MVNISSTITYCILDLDPVVNKHLYHFSYYNFLWKDDLHGNFKEFITADPGMFAIKREVERFLFIEKKVLSIPRVLPVGPICLQTDPIKDALHGFAMAWKTQFASILHEEAKVIKDSPVMPHEIFHFACFYLIEMVHLLGIQVSFKGFPFVLPKIAAFSNVVTALIRLGITCDLAARI